MNHSIPSNSSLDIQAACDAVVEILEALHSAHEFAAFEPILDTLDPARQPIEVALAILFTTKRHGYCPREWRRAADRVKVHVEWIQHPEWKAIGDMLESMVTIPG